MNQQWTREELAERIRNGNTRVVLMQVHTNHCSNEVYRNHLIPTLANHHWIKVGGEGGHRGMPSLYARIFDYPADGSYRQYIQNVIEAKDNVVRS